MPQSPEERKRKLPLFLLFFGPVGAGLTACESALRRLPGVQLSHFVHPQDALAWAEGKEIVAAVVDAGVPAATGIAFLHHLHAWPGPRPHTLLMSDDPELTRPGAAQENGVDDIVSPAVQSAKLVALLRGAIGLREAERASWERTAILEESPTWSHPPATPQPANAQRIAAAALLLALVLIALLWHPQLRSPFGPSAPAAVASGGANVAGPASTLGDSGTSDAGTISQPPRPANAGGTIANVPAAAPVPAAIAGAPANAAPGANPAPGTSAFGSLVLDAAGNVISADEPDLPRAPASTLKLLTAVTALGTLGAPYRFTTKLIAHGAVASGVLDGSIAFVGSGDPLLSTADVAGGVTALANRGVKRVSGNLVIDATACTAPEYNAHWTEADRPFSFAAGTSAVSIDEGMDAGTTIRDQQAFAGALVRRLLLAHQITVDGPTRFEPAPSGGTLVWSHASPPLSALVTRMLAQSDNHVAEQLVCAIGRATTGTGSAGAGLARMRDELTRRGISTGGVALFDGSGLARDDRVTPRALATLLWSIGRSPAGQQIYRDLPHVGTQGNIVAKTGRVGPIEGLAGYLDRPPAGSFSFAFLGDATAGNDVDRLQNNQEQQLRSLLLVADGAIQ